VNTPENQAPDQHQHQGGGSGRPTVRAARPRCAKAPVP
jgi:hypothetical protein